MLADQIMVVEKKKKSLTELEYERRSPAVHGLRFGDGSKVPQGESSSQNPEMN